MSVSKSAVADGTKLVGHAGPIGQTVSGARAVRIAYFPTVLGATALGLLSDPIILTSCAGPRTNTSKSAQTPGSVDAHVRRGTDHVR